MFIVPPMSLDLVEPQCRQEPQGQLGLEVVGIDGVHQALDGSDRVEVPLHDRFRTVPGRRFFAM